MKTKNWLILISLLIPQTFFCAANADQIATPISNESIASIDVFGGGKIVTKRQRCSSGLEVVIYTELDSTGIVIRELTLNSKNDDATYTLTTKQPNNSSDVVQQVFSTAEPAGAVLANH